MEPILVDAFLSIGYDLSWNCQLSVDSDTFVHFDLDGDGLWNKTELDRLTQLADDRAATARLADPDGDGVVTANEAMALGNVSANCRPVWCVRSYPHVAHVRPHEHVPRRHQMSFVARFGSVRARMLAPQSHQPCEKLVATFLRQ